MSCLLNEMRRSAKVKWQIYEFRPMSQSVCVIPGGAGLFPFGSSILMTIDAIAVSAR
jgi:hypothetical protein